jgi:hypothetical protein
MTDDRSLERAARSFIEAGPTQAPDRAVEAALLRVQTTKQERDWHVPWRTPSMTPTTRLLAGIAAIAVILAGGLLLFRPGSDIQTGGPGPSVPGPNGSLGPSAAPSGSPMGAQVPSLTETFVSTRHGFSVHYPAGWTVTNATVAWAPGGSNVWNSGINDELSNVGVARFSGASQALGAGQTGEQWITAYAGGGDPTTWPAVDIGGQAGKIDYDGGPAAGGTVAPGGVMFDAVVVVGGRAYNFNMDGQVDRPTFEAFLATVTFDPASATQPVPPLTQAFSSARHGYRIGLPAAWTATPASAPWPAGSEAAGPPDPMLDIATDPGRPGMSLVGVSQPLATGLTSDEWLTAYERSAPSMPADCWPAPALMETSTIDGQAAWIHGGLATCGFTEALVFAGGRVYEFSAYFPAGGIPMDRDLFDALLGTVKLDPAAADDSPAASARPS